MTERNEVEHLRALMDERDQRYEQRFAAQERAVDVAVASAKEDADRVERSSEKRFDSVNEFRRSLSDLVSTFIPRAEAEQRIASNAEKIDALARKLERIEGRSGGAASLWGYLVAAVGVVAAVAAFVAR